MPPLCMSLMLMWPSFFKSDIKLLSKISLIFSLLVFTFGILHLFISIYSMSTPFDKVPSQPVKEPHADVFLAIMTFILGILGAIGLWYRNPLLIALSSINSAIFFMIYTTYGILVLTTMETHHELEYIYIGIGFLI